MYFSKFPQFIMRLGEEQKVVTDFLIRVGVGKGYKDLSVLLLPYVIRDGEKAEHVAYNIYRNSEYHWVLYLINNITDPYTDWPIHSQDVKINAQKKYDNIEAIHHYELRSHTPTVIIDPYFLGEYDEDEFFAVTNYEFEVAENEKKRTISILQPKYIQEFTNLLSSTLRA